MYVALCMSVKVDEWERDLCVNQGPLWFYIKVGLCLGGHDF